MGYIKKHDQNFKVVKILEQGPKHKEKTIVQESPDQVMSLEQLIQKLEGCIEKTETMAKLIKKVEEALI